MSNDADIDAQEFNQNLILIGCILRPHGTTGEVVMLPSGAEPAQLRQLVAKDFFLQLKSLQNWLRFSLLNIRFHKGMALLKFKGVDSLTVAEKLRGAKVYINELDRPPLSDDEYYYDQLIGLNVIDIKTGETIGKVSDIVYGIGTENLELEINDKHILLPLHKNFIIEINVSDHYLKVSLPDGLMDVYG
ncbi:MAG: ribosome maturation factor RimM [Candidatus Sumerlaeia bacterium]|nr:ribosome maturation factor RimM [Candidatus Sumerlaeia bacterium]